MEKENISNAHANAQPKYQKKTQLEHILLRPDTYIGSVEAEEEPCWVWGDESVGTEVGQKAKGKGKGKAADKKGKKKKSSHDSDDDSAYGSDEDADMENASLISAESGHSSKPGMVYRKVTIVPGLYKIFDEILVNAADNKQRDSKDGKFVMTKLEVSMDRAAGSITVKNNGLGIAVQKHTEYGMYIPQLIFGELLTSSNYDDNVKQTVGGRNGFGAKLANIFSIRFILAIEDPIQGKAYVQEWKNNMSTVSTPKITNYPGKHATTSVTFFPDFKRFGMDPDRGFDEDILALLRKRVWDVAGTTGGLIAASNPLAKPLKVSLDGDVIGVKNFSEYCELFLENSTPRVHEKLHPRWEVCVSLQPINGNAASSASTNSAHVSFVNSISTSRGGTHVNYVQDLIVDALTDILKKGKYGKSAKELKPMDLKRHLLLFVNALIVNPTFDSQTKTYLTTKRADLEVSVDNSSANTPKVITKDKLVLSDSFIKKLTKSGLVEQIVARACERSEQKLSKNDGKKNVKRLTGIPKLEDANEAGTKNGHLCTLILTEGDSAKALAVSGLAVVGRDRYGVFPLKGKLLNVREASHKQIMENAEVTAIKQILGLKNGVKYQNAKDLRYGHVMIMADQDHDGSHIKGLVVNLFAHFWPSLLKLPGFLTEFITPIVKVSKGNTNAPPAYEIDQTSNQASSSSTTKSGKGKKGSSGNQEFCFYSMPEYQQWLSSNNAGKGWSIKYYKGLGTSTSAEAKAYFSEIERHKIDFEYSGHECDAAIDLAFSKNKADARKDWLGNFKSTGGVDGEEGFLEQRGYGQQLTYKEFVDKELILFSAASNARAIPSVLDGLKPGQRKILFACFKRNLKKEIKVAQLAGYVAEQSAYHHGEAALCATIVGLAQSFVGSNNINLLMPNGQFGTRLQGGKDAASPRYIFTTLSPLARIIYPQADDVLLNHLTEDGQSIEPEYYVPIVPMVLINGSAGIGTGWSSNVPNYNPKEIIHCLRTMIEIEKQMVGNGSVNDMGTTDSELDPRLEAAFLTQLQELHPFYKGFDGQIKPKGLGSYVVKGVIERLTPTTIHISELPLHKWTSDYKLVLESMLAAGEIKDFREYHTDTRVSFVVDLTPEQMKEYRGEGATPGMTLYKKFKLNSALSTTNMVLFTRDGVLKRYASALDILLDFYRARMGLYVRRRQALIEQAQATCDKLANKVRFITLVNNGTINVKKNKATLVAQLDSLQFLRIPKTKLPNGKNKRSKGEDGDDDSINSDDEDSSSSSSSTRGLDSDFDYLLSMPIWSLTLERVHALQDEYTSQQSELRWLQSMDHKDLWLNELESFERNLDAHQSWELKREEESAQASRNKRLKAASKAGGHATASGKLVQAQLSATARIKGERIEDNSDDFDEEKLQAQLEKKRGGRKKKEEGTTAAVAVADKLAALLDDEEDADMADAASISSAVPKPTKKLAPTKSTATGAGKKKAAAAAPKKTAAGKKKKKLYDSDNEESDDAVSDFSDGGNDDEVVEIAAPRARSVRAAAAKKTNYAVDNDDDDEVEEEEQDEDDIISIISEEDDEDDFVAPKKKTKATAPKPAAAAASKKTAASKKASAPSASASTTSVSSAASSSELSLADRLAMRFASSVQIESSSSSSLPSSSVFSSTVASKGGKKGAKAKSAAAAAAIVPASEEPMIMTPPKKKATKSSAANKREKEPKSMAALMASPISPDPKRRKLYNSAQSKQRLEASAATPKQQQQQLQQASRPRRAAKPIKSYVELSDDDDEEEEDDDDEEDEEDDSVDEISEDDDDEDYED